MIKENRIKRKITQEELAEKLEMSPRQIQRIERNEDNTKIETIRKIIKILEIPDEEILKYMKKWNLTYNKICVNIIIASKTNYAFEKMT